MYTIISQLRKGRKTDRRIVAHAPNADSILPYLYDRGLLSYVMVLGPDHEILIRSRSGSELVPQYIKEA